MSPGQGKFQSLKGLILHKFNPSKKCFFCQNKVGLFLEGLAILPNFFGRIGNPSKLFDFFRQNRLVLFLEGLTILPNFFRRIDNPSKLYNHKLYWKNWIYHVLVILTMYLVHIIILVLIVFTSFHLHIRNVNEVIWQFWDGENSLFVTQGTSQFLCVSQLFNFFWDVPFVTHREFQNSSTRGFAAREGIFPSQNRQMTSLVQLSQKDTKRSLICCVFYLPLS